VGTEGRPRACRHFARAFLAHGPVLFERLPPDAEQRHLGSVRIGLDATEEVRGAAGNRRHPVPDEAARARLGERELPAASRERATDDLFHAGRALAVAELAEPLA